MKLRFFKFSKAEILVLLGIFGLFALIGPIPLGPSEASVKSKLERELPKGTDEARVKEFLQKEYGGSSWDEKKSEYHALIRNTAWGLILSMDMQIIVKMSPDRRVESTTVRSSGNGP